MSLILYLDTQDYINLFNEPDSGPYHKVLSDILSYRDRGDLTGVGISKRDAKNITKQIKLPTINAQSIVADLETLLGVGRAGHIGHYFTKATKRGFRFKRSDIMDIMQMCYAYDCDLFRCDKAMAHMFNDYRPFKGRLVSHFNDLPERIQVCLDS